MNVSSSPIWAILAAVTWGMTYALDGKILQTNSPLYMAIVNAIMTLVLFVPIAFFSNQGSVGELIHGKQFGLLLLSSVLISLAGLFILYGIKHLGASTASIIEISYPFFVVLFSVLLWRESLTWEFFVGGLLMLCGAIIVIRGHA